MALEFLANGDAAVADGVFIPVYDLPGMNAGELTSGDSDALKFGKSSLAILESLVTGITAATLGLSIAKGNPAGAGANLFNQSFTIQWQKLLNLQDNTITAIPEPTSGANAGNGSLGVVDVFPNASKLAAAGAAPAEGVLIPTADLDPYGAPAHAALTVAASEDNRDWFSALADFVASSATRSTTQESAVITASKGTPSSSALPAAFTATTDPTSGIAAADAVQRALLTRNDTVSIQVELNSATQTFDVRSATA